MQISVEATTGLERRLTIGVPADEIDREVEKRIKDAAGKVQIHGFRKGKVPIKIVKQRYGEGIRNEVLGEVINRTYFEALEQQDIKPAGMPDIDTTVNKEGQDLEYVATFEVYPELQLIEFNDFKITKLQAVVEDSDVDKTIENLRQQNTEWKSVDRTAQEKDQVVIDFCGRKDGEEFAGGKGQQQKLVLGSNQMIPGFEAAIVGMQVGEEKVIPLTFPEDYHSEELKGADVEFTIKVHEINEPILPELNDEFFKKYGVGEGGLEAFCAEVRGNMERELKKASQAKVKNQVLDLLYAKQTVDIPKALISKEVEALRQQMVQQFGSVPKNQDLRSLLPDTMFEEQAKKRVALGLIINEIIKSRDLKADPEKVQAAVSDIAATYHDPDAVARYYNTNAEAKAGVEAMVLEELVVDQILAAAQVEEKQSSYEDALKQEQTEPVA